MYLHDKKAGISWTTNRISHILWIDKVLQYTSTNSNININTHFECKVYGDKDVPHCLPLPPQPMMQ